MRKLSVDMGNMGPVSPRLVSSWFYDTQEITFILSNLCPSTWEVVEKSRNVNRESGRQICSVAVESRRVIVTERGEMAGASLWGDNRVGDLHTPPCLLQGLLLAGH